MTAAHKFAAPTSYTGNLRGMTCRAARSRFATLQRTSAVSTPGVRLASLQLNLGGHEVAAVMPFWRHSRRHETLFVIFFK